MATKSVKKSEARQHRITRSNPLPSLVLEEVAQRSPSCINSQESENNNHFGLQNYDQLKLKPEKESTSPLNHEAQLIPHHPLKAMPLTRSKAHLSNSNTTPIEILPEPITPEDNEHPQPMPQVDTCRKVSRYASCQSLPQPPAIDSFLTVRKPISKQNEQPSPYSEFRKSYRKQHKREIVSVPYRKCHDALEGRIITIMNKIQSGKNCLKDFESLVEKMGRISSKDLLNRYVVSGIKIIIAIALSKDIYDPKSISRLQEEQTHLQTRIAQQVDSFEEFITYPQRPQQIDQHEYKPLVMRKLYSTMKRNFPQRSKAEIRRKVVSECQSFFSGEVSVHMLLKFMRARLEGR